MLQTPGWARLARWLPVGFVACGCAGARAATPSAPVTPRHDEAAASPAKIERAQPLAGRIWDAQARDFLDEGSVMLRAERARFVLLGEKHDNPEHHRLQAL